MYLKSVLHVPMGGWKGYILAMDVAEFIASSLFN